MAERPGRSIDWMTFSLYLALVGIGWLMIYTVGYADDYSKGMSHFFSNTAVGKQTIWIGISFLVLFLIFLIDRKFWETLAYVIYIVAIVVLILVLIFGTEIKGAKSWFVFGGFSLQPAEFAKAATALALARFISSFRTDLRKFRHQITVVGLMAAPMLLILLQPDAGSALVFTSFLVMMYREGFPGTYLVVGFVAVVLLLLGVVIPPIPLILSLCLLAIFALIVDFEKRFYFVLGWGALVGLTYLFFEDNSWKWMLPAAGGIILTLVVIQYRRKKAQLAGIVASSLLVGCMLIFTASFSFNNFLQPHQQDRINVWLSPSKCDPQGSLYNVLQSKMAISAGGFMGKGFLQGNLTKGNFVPEQSTDFIFCTIGEEQGFIGSLGIILLFSLFIWRITLLAERQRSPFNRCYAYGVAGILFIHFAVNIGMTMGLMPIIGIPLPLISKGGSSLLGFTILIGLLLKLDSHRFTV